MHKGRGENSRNFPLDVCKSLYPLLSELELVVNWLISVCDNELESSKDSFSY